MEPGLENLWERRNMENFAESFANAPETYNHDNLATQAYYKDLFKV